MEPPLADWKCDRFAPQWASTFHYRSIQRQDHLQVTNSLRDRTQNATQLQQQLFRATGVRVSTQTVRNRLRAGHRSQVTGLYALRYRHLPLSLFAPFGMGMHSSFKSTMQEPIERVLAKDHLQFRRITTFPWPAKSPDLSPIDEFL